ncbi:MAG: hypothetical protein IT168_26085 [Bryobacterales bacterium]|nr:hypothetical protein [Bryobacterales bacterium]
MDDELRGLLVGRIQDVCTARAKAGGFAINEAAQQVIDEFKADDNKRWKALRDYYAQQGVIHMVNRVITQAKTADPAQRNLPGLESMPLLITAEGAAILTEQLKYDRFQSEVKRLEKRIKSYSNRRRKPENLAMDQRRLEEMKKFDPRFAKYAETNPDLTLAEAKQIEAKQEPGPAQETSKTKRKRGKKVSAHA